MYPDTKAERRERKRQKRNKMRVSGASTKLLWEVIVRKSDAARAKAGRP